MRKEVQIMATKRISCKEWCEKNNVPIESLVVNRGKDDDKYFFIEQKRIYSEVRTRRTYNYGVRRILELP